MIICEKITPFGDKLEMVEQKSWTTAFYDKLYFGSYGPRRYTSSKLFVRRMHRNGNLLA